MKQKFKAKVIEFCAPIKEFHNAESQDFFVEGVAINETTTRNGITYVAAELEKSFHSLIGKPMLKDHNNSVDSIVGRVKEAGFENKAIKFKAQVMDKAMQEMIRDGRVQNVSIGAKVDALDEKEGQRVAKGLEFLELSFVAVPGDPGATLTQALEEAFMVNEEVAEAMKCPECGKMLDSKEEMSKHMASKHGDKEEKMAEQAQEAKRELPKEVTELLAKLSERLEAQDKILAELQKPAEKKEEKGKVAKEAPAEEKSSVFYARERDSNSGFWTVKVDPITRMPVL